MERMRVAKTRRPRCPAFRDALCDRGSRPAEVGLVVHEADHRAEPISFRAHAEGDRSPPSWATPKYGVPPPGGARQVDPSRAIPAAVERKAPSPGAPPRSARIPAGARSTFRRRCRPHMQATWDLFGFDVKQYDPDRERPRGLKRWRTTTGGGPARLGREPAPTRPKRFLLNRRTSRSGEASSCCCWTGVRPERRRSVSWRCRRGPRARPLAAEWNAQVDIIDPVKMPLTRIANSAIDGVADQMTAVADEVRTYLTSDLVVYRAAAPRRRWSRPKRTLGIPCSTGFGTTFHVPLHLGRGASVFVHQPAVHARNAKHGPGRDRGHRPGGTVQARRHACDDEP